MKNKAQEMSESGFCEKFGAGGDSDTKEVIYLLQKQNSW